MPMNGEPLGENRVGADLPTVEVRFRDLDVRTLVYLGNRAVPTLLNAYRNQIEVRLYRDFLLDCVDCSDLKRMIVNTTVLLAVTTVLFCRCSKSWRVVN